jgi:hypothetical protein
MVEYLVANKGFNIEWINFFNFYLPFYFLFAISYIVFACKKFTPIKFWCEFHFFYEGWKKFQSCESL